MLRRICILMAACGIYSCANAGQQMHQLPQEILDQSDRDEEELLFEFYTKEIEGLEEQDLKRNPEPLLRRAIVWFEMIGSLESLEELQQQLILLKEDLQFVLKYASSQSRHFAAAKAGEALITSILNASPQSLEDIYAAFASIQEDILRQWAVDPSAKGNELRRQVFTQVNRCEAAAKSFYDYCILMQNDPDVVLGCIPVEVKVVGLVPDDEDNWALLYKLEYQKPGGKYVTIETEI